MLAEGRMEAGVVTVSTTERRGHTVEEIAERLLNTIVYVAEDSDSVIHDQAVAFKENIRQAIIYYMKQAVVSDRTTLYNLFLMEGQTELAEMIRRI